jgi:hypothetical protein
MDMQERVVRVTEGDGRTVTTDVSCIDLGKDVYRVAGIPVPSESLEYGDEFEGRS